MHRGVGGSTQTCSSVLFGKVGGKKKKKKAACIRVDAGHVFTEKDGSMWRGQGTKNLPACSVLPLVLLASLATSVF